MSELLTTRNRAGLSPSSFFQADIAMPAPIASDISAILYKSFLDNYTNRARFHVGGLISNPQQKQPIKTLKENLAETVANLKTTTAQVAMHLDKEWRSKLFKKLDGLLDPENWDENDRLIDPASFGTFLRMIIYKWPVVSPSLGVSQNGQLLAAWSSNNNNLTIEFFPRDEIRWVVVCSVEGEKESAAGITNLTRLSNVLAPYNPSQWFAEWETHTSQNKTILSGTSAPQESSTMTTTDL